MLIIADAGATKCAWKFVDDRGQVVTDLAVVGINFAHQAGRLREALDPAAYQALEAAFRDHPGVRSIFFYGAGVIVGPDGSLPDSLQGLAAFFRTWCPGAKVEYASDLLGAARAVCQRGRGIAAILGTGSNSCFYDGEKIVRNVRSGGFILGDEGGGASLGRQFMADFLKGLVPEPVSGEFAAAFPVDYLTVVREVYRGERPAAYLASFAPWILERYGRCDYVTALVEDNFRSFVRRCIRQYEAAPVGIVGGFAKANEAILRKVFAAEGVAVSTILADPTEGLIRYHCHGL